MSYQTKPGKAVAVKASPVKVAAKVTSALASKAPTAHKADNRTFHVEDYRRASQLIKSMREGKTGTQDQWVDALAVSMAAVFEADSEQFGVPFSPSYFVAGTK